MVSVHQSEDAQPLDTDDIIHILKERLHSIGFTKDGYSEQIYAVEVEAVQFPEITMKMSDGSKFKLTVKEVQ